VFIIDFESVLFDDISSERHQRLMGLLEANPYIHKFSDFEEKGWVISLPRADGGEYYKAC
jgi:hypothetical protein